MNAPHQKGAAVRLEGVVKRYPGFQLGPLDLVVEPGTVIALIGPNGAGKTTTLNCIAGLLVPDEGEVSVYGRDTDPNRPAYRADLGYVGEESGFFKRWSVRRNFEFLAGFVPSWSLQRSQELAERLALPLDQRVAALSRGNLTKLSLVAAVAHGPRLLLLDEPTAGLDPVVRAEVLDLLWEITEDGEHAVLYSTHVLQDVNRLADELVFIRKGQVAVHSGREALIDGWRRISFRSSEPDVALEGVVEHRRVGGDHQVVSNDAATTLGQLDRLGIEPTGVSRMSLDEIAVLILKEEHDVARSAS